MAPPQTFLYWQHSTAFVQCVKQPTSVPKILSDSFQPFARDLGIQVTLNTLSAFQMDPNVVWRCMPFLGWCARAFSLVKQGLNFKRPELYHMILRFGILHFFEISTLSTTSHPN